MYQLTAPNILAVPKQNTKLISFSHDISPLINESVSFPISFGICALKYAINILLAITNIYLERIIILSTPLTYSEDNVTSLLCCNINPFDLFYLAFSN